MLPKGTMISVKKILGVGSLIIGGMLLLNFDNGMQYINQYPQLFSIGLIFSGYLLVIAGRRKND